MPQEKSFDDKIMGHQQHLFFLAFGCFPAPIHFANLIALLSELKYVNDSLRNSSFPRFTSLFKFDLSSHKPNRRTDTNFYLGNSSSYKLYKNVNNRARFSFMFNVLTRKKNLGKNFDRL